MAKWRYTNTQAVTYAEYGVLAEHDSVHEWPDEPPADGHWELVGGRRARRELTPPANQRGGQDEVTPAVDATATNPVPDPDVTEE